MDWFKQQEILEENCGQDARRRFKLSEADPCMLYKEDEKGVHIIIIYIDDMLIIAKEEAIHDAIKVFRGHFQVKDPTSLEDY